MSERSDGWIEEGGLLRKMFDGAMVALCEFRKGRFSLLYGRNLDELPAWLPRLHMTPESIDAAYAAEVARRREAERVTLEWVGNGFASTATRNDGRPYLITRVLGEYQSEFHDGDTWEYLDGGNRVPTQDKAIAVCERHAAQSEPAETPPPVLTWWGNEDVLYAKHPGGEGSYLVSQHWSHPGEFWCRWTVSRDDDLVIHGAMAECQAACEKDAAEYLAKQGGGR